MILIVAVLAISLISFAAIKMTQKDGKEVIVTVEGKEVYKTSIKKDQIYQIPEKNGTNVMQIKDGKFVDAVCDEGFWYLTILGLCAWLCGSAAFDSAVLSTAGMWMSIAGAIGLLIAGGRGRKGIGKIVGGFSNLYNITSWISDILSYARLLALGLATGVIAQVVNTMGSLFGGGIAGLILFLLIFAVGHAVNFAINLLGAFIHSARLQYVEFFGKFYVDGGEPFDPLRRKTKYIRVDEE